MVLIEHKTEVSGIMENNSFLMSGQLVLLGGTFRRVSMYCCSLFWITFKRTGTANTGVANEFRKALGTRIMTDVSTLQSFSTQRLKFQLPLKLNFFRDILQL